ncbi:MAG: argininosuccinate synthase [Clostridiales Family XIII bacterium]|jgi:argininosuccinate synthase|nr:argininosuccinate synthase [Clostridiales Family XIII bacterium]
MAKKEKIVLAYSGGLDTSIILTWLKENYDAEVIAADGDVGQDDDFKYIRKKAYATGADNCYILDLKDEFVTGYIWPVVKAGAVYEDDYLLGTSMARPLIAQKLVEIAQKEGAKYIAHGATGKGNDQVRFESTIHALDPSIKIIAPWRIWDFKSREDLLAYAKKHKIPLEQSAKKIWSRDQNLWHISHEGGNLEDPWEMHPDNVHVMSKPIEKAPDKPAFVELEFAKGVPVALNGKKMKGAALLAELNKIGGKHGVGTIDIVENRLVGMKSRGVYETPGGTIIMNAHKALEKLVLDRDTLYEKGILARRYAQLVYDGKWFTPLREAIDAFVDVTQEVVTGTVRVELYKGNALPCATKAPASLYSEEFATFGEDEVYNQKDAEGFINLFSLSMKIRAMQKQKSKKRK